MNYDDYLKRDWTEQFITLSTGIRLCYLTLGPASGKPVVLLHGATDSRISWSQVAPVLAAKGYCVYIPELRGHGKSRGTFGNYRDYSAETLSSDVLAFLDALHLHAVTLVGHSIGSFIALRLSALHPERIRNINLIAAAEKIYPADLLNWILEGDGDFKGIFDSSYDKGFPDSFLKLWAECPNDEPGFEEAVYAHAKALPVFVFRSLFRCLTETDQTPLMKDVTCPVELFWGKKDELFGMDAETDLMNSLSHTTLRFHPVEGTGHNTHWENRRIAECIADRIVVL